MFESTTTPLAANITKIIGPWETSRAQNITGSVFADQTGTLTIEQSFDGTNFDVIDTITFSASQGTKINVPVIAPYARAKFVNGSTPQGVFRLFVRSFQSGAT